MAKKFYDRHFPVRPNLDQLKHQARDLLRAIRKGNAEAIAELRKHHPDESAVFTDPAKARLADAQFALARSYGLPSWPRLVTACRMTDAIWRGDIAAVRALVVKDARLLQEAARGVPDSNWGPPLSYAANVGQNEIIDMLREMGATDVQHAFERACLQGKVETARRLHAMGARPSCQGVMWCCETLNDAGMSLLLDMGAEFSDDHGNRLAPAANLLQTYTRYPEGKHRCLELVAAHGVQLPDTPVVALHRGRIDLLEAYLQRDSGMVRRTFSLEEIYPPALGCGPDFTFALHGTPLHGTTLLHICVEFDEIEIARWLVEHGADVNAKAEVDSDGFGGQTPLFHCVVNDSNLCGRQRDGAFTRLLLDHGADPNARASLRKQLRFVPDESLHEYHDVTPLAWGEQFHGQKFHDWVSKTAMQLIAERGGHK
jgi:ankyrin repeat protein